MSWASKGLCTVVFLTSLALVYAMGETNLNSFNNVKDSIEEIYEDRLVVNGMIYELAGFLHEKEVALASQNYTFFTSENEKVNKQAFAIINAFKKTYLTDIEAFTLNHFETSFHELAALEKGVSFAEEPPVDTAAIATLLLDLKALNSDLDKLSDIQLAEGKNKLAISKNAAEAMETYRSLEKYFLIITAVLIFIIILLPSSKEKDEFVSE
ncbi:MCP four helix bundle domain-containing protein [Alteromonas sp. BMJM2]|uniref:MCP four helix bundle domain-containing protein n=1 Tax=Alteromonas sp. BMJM2 TaxID=2954241 RepID=UPI0022B3D147|nr:MCP four helix bundle domain-containing protein [Alteromonas sp. BMJM2]